MSGTRVNHSVENTFETKSDRAGWCCVVASNSEEILKSNLLSSPDLQENGIDLSIQKNKRNAGCAYNQGIDTTSEPIIVFAHQDVYLPAGWQKSLNDQIELLNQMDPTWAVAGVMGVAENNETVGKLWSTGLGREIGETFEKPVPAASIDEVLLIVRRSSGLRFDENLPSFHLYGTDIVRTAIDQGHGAYIIHAPLIHNSRAVKFLDSNFQSAFGYLQGKWSDRLPMRTPVTVIDASGDALQKTNAWLLKNRWKRRLRRLPGLIKFAPDGLFRTPRPRSIARRLGYE